MSITVNGISNLNTFNLTDVKVSLTDVLGRGILNAKFENGSMTKTINLSQMAQGVYYIKVESGKNNFVTKLVKE